jgi:hypothetical protein
MKEALWKSMPMLNTDVTLLEWEKRKYLENCRRTPPPCGSMDWKKYGKYGQAGGNGATI